MRNLMLDKEAFEEWRTQETTRAFMQFLKDRICFQKERWASGADWTPEAKILVLTLEFILNMTHEDIVLFYQNEEHRNGD